MNEARIRELEAAERKLQALEAGGVDNWDGYDSAMEQIIKAQETENKADELLERIAEELSDGIHELEGLGCGYGFYEASMEKARMVILKFIKADQAVEVE